MFHPIDTITPESLRELMNSYGSSRRPNRPSNSD